MAELQNLARDSHAGYRQANMLIGKLGKAVNDDGVIGNRSAFIYTGAVNAWKDVYRERAAGTAMDVLPVMV